MQKKPSPRSCVAAYWRKPPIRLPSVLSPVGWMPEKMRMGGGTIGTCLDTRNYTGAMAVTPATWTPSSWRDTSRVAPARVARCCRRRGRARAASCSAAARLRGRGARAAGGARRGRRRPGVPAPGGRLRGVVPRLHGGLDPREAEDPAADVGGDDLRVGAAAREGRPDRRAVRKAEIRAGRARRRRRAAVLLRAHGQRRRSRRRRREPPTRRGWSRPTTSPPRRSICFAPSRRAASPT